MENECITLENSRKRKKTIFHFLDYRHYLNDLFTQIQLDDTSFSYRKFARLAESTSPNFLQLLSAGKISITDRQADAIARNVPLRDKENDYFRALIDFDHADTHSAKNEAFRRIMDLRRNRTVNHIADSQYQYLTEWYNPVVRELICSLHFDGDLQKVGDLMVPPVGLREIKKSVQILEELGMIRPRVNGVGWEASDTVISTPDEVLNVAVIEYHRQMLERASQALELFSGTERDCRAVTLGISKEKYEIIKQRVVSFWHELLEEADTCDDTEMVVQVNMQLFPLTKVVSND